MSEDAVERWVKRLNAVARKLDEDAASLHPSAWPEALKVDMERWKRFAKEGQPHEHTSRDRDEGPI